MKRLFSFSMFLLFIGFTFSAFSQEVYWEITKHSTNVNKLRNEITEYMENGLVPVGISYDNTQLHILYIDAPELDASAWYIEWYDDTNSLQNGITNNMNQGYMPNGITYTGDLFYVMYIMVDNAATAWQLVPSATNLNAVRNAIQPYVSQTYLPVGITALGREYWTLLVRIPNTTVRRWLIETYTADSQVLTNNINANINKGYLPLGFMYRGNEVDILYWGF